MLRFFKLQIKKNSKIFYLQTIGLTFVLPPTRQNLTRDHFIVESWRRWLHTSRDLCAGHRITRCIVNYACQVCRYVCPVTLLVIDLQDPKVLCYSSRWSFFHPKVLQPELGPIRPEAAWGMVNFFLYFHDYLQHHRNIILMKDEFYTKNTWK